MAATPAPAPSFAAVVVAAGKGLRAGQPVPKQFAQWRGKPVVRHSVEALLAAGAREVVIAIPPGGETLASDALEGLEHIALVEGGATRQASVRAALEALAERPPPFVLIHDAARPDLPEAVISRLLNSVGNHGGGAIPVLPVVDSLVVAEGEAMRAAADRSAIRRVQTPQAFAFDAILEAHRSWSGEALAGDDAQVLMQAGGTVRLVEGDERLAKLTFAHDFASPAPSPSPRRPAIRTGMGYDVHRLAVGEELWLGGLKIAHSHGLAGHSDADVALHAIVDALLGAAAAGDIGDHFPPSDPQWKGASSDRFIAHAAKLVEQAGYGIANVDLTIVCEAPRIGPHRTAMQARIADLLGVDPSQVSVKATTTERLGFAGRKEGIAAHAIATLHAFEHSQ